MTDQWQIAPFLSIRNQSGTEVLRYKSAGHNDGLVKQLWEGWRVGREDVPVPVLEQRGMWSGGESTFFTLKVLVEEGFPSGTYTAEWEFPNVPHTFQSAGPVTFVVTGAPLVYSVESPTNAESVTVNGLAKPGVEVTVYVRKGGVLIDTVDGIMANPVSGAFETTVQLPDEGEYVITATAKLGEQETPESEPVTVVVDRTPPGTPADLEATSLAGNSMTLTWSRPAEQHEDIDYYQIWRRNLDDEESEAQLIVAPNDPAIIEDPQGGTFTFNDSGLTPGTEYEYSAYAVDEAGNGSVTPATATATTMVTEDTEPPSAPGGISALVDGNTVTIRWGESTDNVAVVGYRLYRQTGAENEPLDEDDLVVEVPFHAERRYWDTDLEYDTTYTYTVTAYDAKGLETDASAEDYPARITVTTPEPVITIAWVRWQSEFISAKERAIEPGAIIQVSLSGDRGREAYATIEYDAYDGKTSSTIDLDEETDDNGNGTGTYRATTTVPDGVARVLSVTGELSDGKGHSKSKQAAGLPAAVAGSIEVHVEAPSGVQSLQVASLSAWSNTAGGSSTPINGTGTYTITGLVAASDYVVTVKSQGKVLAEVTGVTVFGGRTSELTLKPRLPASLYLRVVDENNNPMPLPIVTAKVGDRQYLVNRAASDGWGSVSGEFFAGDVVTINASPQKWEFGTYMPAAPVDVPLEPDRNEATVVIPYRPKASLQVSVYWGRQVGGDIPLTGANVIVVQDIDGYQPPSQHGTTDDDGQLTFDELCAAPATIRVYHELIGSESWVIPALGAGENRVFSQTIPAKQRLSLDISTKNIGDDEYSLHTGWRTQAHVRTTITNLGTEDNPKNNRIWFTGDLNFIPISGTAPGDRIRIQVDGSEGNLTNGDVTITLDENAFGYARIQLLEQGKFAATVRDSSGSARDGTKRYATVYRKSESGERVFFKSFESKTADVSCHVGAGTYTLVFHWGTLPVQMRAYEAAIAYLGDQCVVIDDVSVQDGELTDVGFVTLPAPEASGSAYFRGKPGNDLFSTKAEAVPGSTITLRGTYRYDASQGAPRDLTIHLGVPIGMSQKGATLVPGSVAVSVLSGPEPVITYGTESVQLYFGDAAVGGISGVVLYQARLADNYEHPSISARSWAEFKTGAITRTEEIAVAVVSTPVVTMSAPSNIWERENIPVTGFAPPLATVRVWDSYYLLGETIANEYGAWKLTVSVPNRGPKAYHYLWAEAVVEVEPANEVAPTWPDGEIAATEVTRRTLKLAWSGAEDDKGVTEYVLTGYLEDGSVALEYTTLGTSLDITGL